MIDSHEQRRVVEKLLSSKAECSSTLHYRGMELIRTHERLIAVAEKAQAYVDAEQADDEAIAVLLSSESDGNEAEEEQDRQRAAASARDRAYDALREALDALDPERSVQ